MLEQCLGTLGHRLDMLGNRLDILGHRLGSIGYRLDTLGNRLGTIGHHLNIIGQNVHQQLHNIHGLVDQLRRATIVSGTSHIHTNQSLKQIQDQLWAIVNLLLTLILCIWGRLFRIGNGLGGEQPEETFFSVFYTLLHVLWVICFGPFLLLWDILYCWV